MLVLANLDKRDSRVRHRVDFDPLLFCTLTHHRAKSVTVVEIVRTVAMFDTERTEEATSALNNSHAWRAITRAMIDAGIPSNERNATRAAVWKMRKARKAAKRAMKGTTS